MLGFSRDQSLVHAVRRSRYLYSQFGLEPFRHRWALRRLRTDADAVEDMIGAFSRPYSPDLPPIPADQSLTINWVLPSMTLAGGGVGNVVEIIGEFERRGHTSRLYSQDRTNAESIVEQQALLRRRAPAITARVEGFANQMEPADITVATAWQTAYSVLRHRPSERLFYLVQDYEPYFSPRGSNYELAVQSYLMGLATVTLGPWIAEILRHEHGVAADQFPLAVATSSYRLENTGAREGILFYARPETDRRGFEIGLLALELFHNRHPDVPISFIGSDLPFDHLRFPVRNLGVLSPAALNTVYNQSVAALVLSYTNASLLPNELLAAGCIPVSNNDDCARSVIDNEFVEYSSSSPVSLAEAIASVVTADVHVQLNRAGRAAASVQHRTWSVACDAIEASLRRALPFGARSPRGQSEAKPTQ